MYFIYVNKDLLAKPSHLPIANLIGATQTKVSVLCNEYTEYVHRERKYLWIALFDHEPKKMHSERTRERKDDDNQIKDFCTHFIHYN